MSQAVQTPTRAGMPGLRPLSGLIGRSGEMGRLLGHIDARRCVRLCAPRGAGTTALLRVLCAEPARPGSSDGTVALPVGLPVADLGAVLGRLVGDDGPMEQRRLLVLMDDRDASPADLAALQEQLASSVLVVTGEETLGDAPSGDAFTPMVLPGLSEHHAVGLVEAAMGRPLSIDEGRAARFVATAVQSRPVWLLQAAAGVRDGGLTFTEIRELLGDPPHPAALTVALQHALDDDLHATLTDLRALGQVPAPTGVVAAACGLDAEETARRMRRLSLLGLACTDGRDGWTAAVGVPEVSEPIRAGVAQRVADWLDGEDPARLDIFVVASVSALVADRVAADDRSTTRRLAGAALDRLGLEDLLGTRALLDRGYEWAAPPPPPVDVVVTSTSTADEPAGGEATGPGSEVADVAASRSGVDGGAVAERDPAASPGIAVDAAHGTAGEVKDSEPSTDAPVEKDVPWLSSLLSDWRRLAIIAVAAAAVIAGVLLAVPMLRQDTTPAVVRSDVDLGVASIGDSASGTLTLDLAGRPAATPLDLVVSGPDADAFAVDPTRCDGLDCRASLTFTADRSGTHLATVTAVDARGVEHAVVELTGEGTGDPPDRPVVTDLAVTLFPAEPSPVPSGGTAVVPIGVGNNGPADSGGIRLTVEVPQGVTASATGCAFEGVELTCPLAEVPAGAQERVAVTVSVPAGASTMRVNATVTPLADTDEAQGDNAAGFTYPVSPPPA